MRSKAKERRKNMRFSSLRKRILLARYSDLTRGAFFVKGGRENFLITDGRYAEQSKREAKEYEILITSEAHPTCAILRRLVCRCKVTKVLFDGTVTPYSVVEDLRRELPEVVFSSQKRALQELRIVK